MLRKPIEYAEDSATGCWVWQKAVKGPRGYGCKKVAGKTVSAHRHYYEQANGPIPEGLTMDHLCRNRLCVNPDHLEAVTNAENVRRGHSTKLTWAAVKAIRASDLPYASLAQQHGVATSTIQQVRQRSIWK